MKKKINWSIKIINPVMIMLIIIILWIPEITTAEEADTLTINSAVKIAVENNNELKQKKQTVSLQEISVVRSKGTFYPDLSIGSGGAYKDDKNTPTGNDNEFRTLDINIKSTLNVFNGFQDSASLKRSQIELEAEVKNYSRSVHTCILNTILTYIETVSNQELIKAETENLKANQNQLEQIKVFYNSGKKSVIDLYQQQAETREAELTHLSAQNKFRVSRLELSNSMGMVGPFEFNVSLPEVVITDKTFPDYDYQDLLNAAYKNRPDYQSGDDQIHAADEGIREAKGGYLPRIDLFGEAGSGYNSNYNDDFNNQVADNSISSSFGFTVSIPIFDRSVTRSKVIEAKILRDKRLLEKRGLKQKIQLNIGEALDDYRTALKQADVSAAILKYSKKVLDSMSERYEAGGSSISELIDARSDYAKAKFNNITAGYDLLKKKVALAYYQGDVSAMIPVDGTMAFAQ